MTNKCAGKNKQGLPCKATSQVGSDWCYFHDPEKAKERATARAKGGRARRYADLNEVKDHSLDDPEAILTVLEDTLRSTLLQDNTTARTRAIDALLKTAIKLKEATDFDARIAALERILDRSSK